MHILGIELENQNCLNSPKTQSIIAALIWCLMIQVLKVELWHFLKMLLTEWNDIFIHPILSVLSYFVRLQASLYSLI